MEFLNWKNTLLEWANRLEYLGRPYYSLNLAEIESFFNVFKTNVSVNIASMQLSSFFEAHYPTFHPMYDKERKVCPEDYVYGYSLLMHFSCVKYPESSMQDICKQMQEETQMTIKTFLQNLMDRKSFDRETIKSVIESSAPAKISDYVLVLSPVKTTELELCPPTPKTKMMNDWNSENRQLKALVDTERFERGFLELQLKKQDEQITLLNNERRKFITDIQELKSQLSQRDLENIPPNNNTDSEVLKRRLRKEILDKDALIVDLQQKVDVLTDAKQDLAEKFAYVESQYNKATESTSILTAKLDEVTDDCDKKLQHIEGLEITIKEYQKYFNDMNSKGTSLDVSSENLDDSYAIAMANMPSLNMPSPENLSKVVDIQLREQILLYEQLLDQYKQIQDEKISLNNKIVDLIQEHSQKTNALESKCHQIEEENSRNIQKYEEKLQEIATLSRESETNLKEFQLLRREFDSLILKINESNKNIECLNNTRSSLESQLKTCESEIIVLKDNNSTIAAENAEYVVQLERFKFNQNDLKLELENKEAIVNSLKSSILQLQEQIEKSNESESLLQSEVGRLKKRVNDSDSQINELEQEKLTLNEDYRVSLNDKETALLKIEQERNDLIVELQQQATSVSELTAHIVTTEAKLDAVETLRSDLAARYEELQVQKDTQLDQFEKERDSLSVTVKDLTFCLSEAEALKSELLHRNEELIREMEKEKSELSSEIRHLSANQVNLKASLTAAESQQNELLSKNEQLILENIDKECKIETMIQECKDNKKESATFSEEIVNLTNHIQTLQKQREIIDSTLADVTSSNKLLESESQLIREQLHSMDVIRLDLETQLNQSEEEKEKLFLTLQEKMDEGEAIESKLNEVTKQIKANEVTNCEILMEKNTLVNSVAQLKSNSTMYETKIKELEETIGELTACKEVLIETNNSLQQEMNVNCENLVQLRSELEIINKNAEQDIIDKKQFAATIDQLTASKNAIEEELNATRSKLSQSLDVNSQMADKSRLLDIKLKEINNEHLQVEQKFADLQIENGKLKKSVADLEVNRDELLTRIDSAERELISSQDAVKQKNNEAADLFTQIQELTTESETVLAEKIALETDLNKNHEQVQQLTKELDQNKTDLIGKEKSIIQLNEQIETLRTVESSMVGESNKVTNELKELVLKLESVESSREALSVKCISLGDELKKFQDKYTELENKFVERQGGNEAVKLQEVEFDNLRQEMAQTIEIKNQELSDLKLELKMIQDQMANASTRAEEREVQHIAELNGLKETIEKFDAENTCITNSNENLTKQVLQLQITNESYQKSSDYKTDIQEFIKDKEALTLRVDDLMSEMEKMREDLEKAKSENIGLSDENVDLATEIENVRKEYLAEIENVRKEYLTREETKQEEIRSLQFEIKNLMTSTCTNNESVKLGADLKIALADLESKMVECQQAEERLLQINNDNRILSAKLTKHREITLRKEEDWTKEKASLMQLADQADNKIKENRLELEMKLQKMKEKMKQIYTEETSKAKEKHERELAQSKSENRSLLEKVDKYENHVRSCSKQIYVLNDQNLELKKDNEFLKNKLRLAENNPRDSAIFPAPNFGSNFKMDDEEGEIFNNKYLADLKSGATTIAPTGRDSVRFSELQQRNFIAAPHLRSTYIAQYGDQNLKEEDISTPFFNDSMFSNQLDVRRGTLYQRPGPPTPSKNGGRLSIGSNVTASDLFPKDVLREQNNNTKTKITPRKLMSMFSSSKHKVETKQRKSINRPIYSPFTSTPRQKLVRKRRLIAKDPNSNQFTESDKSMNDTLDSIEDDRTSTTSNNSLLSKSIGKFSTQKSISRRYSIISKQRNVSVAKNMQQKIRLEYREKNRSKRLADFEKGREGLNTSDDEAFNNIKEQSTYLEHSDYLEQMFPLEFALSERFEILAKHTTSEHPYSNEPTTIEASETSLLSTSLNHSKTMCTNIIHGKIPKIPVNTTPQRELIQSKRTVSLLLSNMDVFKKIIIISILIVLCVPCAIYAMSNLLIRKS